MKKAIPYLLFFIIAILILLMIKKPDLTRFTKQHFYDSISIQNKTDKISVLRDYTKYLTIYIDSINNAVTVNDSLHSVEISSIQTKTQKELEEIRENYIISGSDSSELLQEITLYKELDFCQEQRELEIIVIRKQHIKIENLNSIIESYESKEDIYIRMLADCEQRTAVIEKVYKKKLLKTKIFSGIIVAGVIVLAVVFGG